MRTLSCAALLLCVACSSEYDVGAGLDPEVVPPDADAGDDDDDPWTPVDTEPGDDDDDVPGGDDGTPHREPDEPPPTWGWVDCPDGILATWHGGELVVFSDDPPAVGTLDVPEAGMYDVYDLAVAESGPSQTNESAFLRIPSSWTSTGHALPFGLQNCDDDYVAVDPDNGGPPAAGATQYLGTFYLEEGANEVELHHYCERYFDGACGQLHDGGTSCDDGINSVHFTGEAVCLVRVLAGP